MDRSRNNPDFTAQDISGGASTATRAQRAEGTSSTPGKEPFPRPSPAGMAPAPVEGAHPDLDQFQEGVNRLTQEGQQILGTVNGLLNNARKVVQQNVEQRPYVMLGAAAGVGYVLGGGLSSALTQMGIRVGSRFILARIVKDVVEASGIQELLQADKMEKPAT